MFITFTSRAINRFQKDDKIIENECNIIIILLWENVGIISIDVLEMDRDQGEFITPSMATFGLAMRPDLKKEGGHTYIEVGNGPVMVVLHGLFGALSNFSGVIDHFSKNYRVVIPMMPIYSLPLDRTNVRELAMYIAEFIAYKGFGHVILLGNSLGGHVSLVYSVNHPEQVDALILTGSSGLYENAFGGTFPRREDKEYIRKKVEITFYDPVNATDELVDEVFGIINDKERVIRVLALAKSAIRHNMADELPGIHIPTCLIWGRNDIITPPVVADDFHALIPDSELYWIDQCGHAPMMERPEQFNLILQDWLDRRFPSGK